MADFGEVSVTELDAEIKAGKSLVLLDVRGDDELEVSKLDGIVHIPMGEVPLRKDELNPEDEIVVICRTGNRSEKVAKFLAKNGFGKVRNMVGGMNGWATEVDPSMETY